MGSVIVAVSVWLVAASAAARPPEAPAVSTTVLTIDQAVGITLAANLDLIAARYNVPMTRADELTAALWYNPVLQVDTVFQPFKGTWDQQSAGGPRQYDLTVSYPIDVTRKIKKRTESAREATKVAEAAFQDAVRLKILEVRLAYIDGIAATETLSLAREKETNLQRLVDLVQARIRGSGLLPLIQTRAKLALERAKRDTRQREGALRLAKTQMSLEIGRPEAGRTLEFGTRLRDFKFDELPPPEDLVSAAFAQRPDLAALRLTRSKTVADQILNRALIWDNPVFMLGASTQRSIAPNPNDPTTARIPGSKSWTSALAIPLPFFNRNQGQIKKTEFALEQTDKQIAALSLSIRKELEAITEQLALKRELIVALQSGDLKNAEAIRDAEQKLFGTGGHALLDYFDALQAYQDTLSEYYDALAEYRRNQARLNASLGKDLAP